jgi:diguanylate cyclase (GGDEF)-like protein/PAS domain S-box-containing protein
LFKAILTISEYFFEGSMRIKKSSTSTKKTTAPRVKASSKTLTCNLLSTNKLLPTFFQNVQQEDLLHLFSHTIEKSPVAIIITDNSGQIEYVNPCFVTISHCLANRIVGKKLIDIHQSCVSAELYTKIWKLIQAKQSKQSEIKIQNKSGKILWESARIQPVLNRQGRPAHFIIFLEDITGRKLSEALVEHMEHYDSLTDLPNRRLFNQRLHKHIQQAEQNKSKIGIALLGLDRFKNINNTLGHEIGDQLIQQVGKRLQQNLGQHDIISRMGGDEFILLLPNIKSFREISTKANTVMACFSQPFHIDQRELYVKASMGISLFPEDGQDSLALLKNADAALNDAKQSGRNVFKFYTAKLNAMATEQLSLENDLRRALDKNEFLVFYQPQVNFMTGHIVGMEALVRWQHPHLGLLAPDKFIPLAEETGMIVALGHWVLRTACQQIILWHQAGYPHLRMSVNLSVRQFQEPELVESILGICSETGLDPRFLELEITESIFSKDIHITNMILQWLHKKGITIAIDDFGTGYSSLTYLKRFPIKTLKIDKSFIQDCLINADDAAIVTTITSIAQNLKMYITAEGVEQHAQLHFLRSLGCHNFQGFLFSKPLPSNDFTDLLVEGRSLSTLSQ